MVDELVDWLLKMMWRNHGISGIGDDHSILPTKICKEESWRSFYTNYGFVFAGTDGRVVIYVLAKLTKVVLASMMLIPFRCNQCMILLICSLTVSRPKIPTYRNDT